jgi:hypothetical protein
VLICYRSTLLICYLICSVADTTMTLLERALDPGVVTEMRLAISPEPRIATLFSS